MIVTGIIVCAVAAVLSIINMLFLMGSAVAERGGGVVVGFVFHALCAIGWVVGLALVALGLAEKYL